MQQCVDSYHKQDYWYVTEFKKQNLSLKQIYKLHPESVGI